MLDKKHFLGYEAKAVIDSASSCFKTDQLSPCSFGAAAWHLKDRDTIFGWRPVIRAQRLNLALEPSELACRGSTP
jgi:hypothetical protein